jgi:hypothetical protein
VGRAAVAQVLSVCLRVAIRAVLAVLAFPRPSTEQQRPVQAAAVAVQARHLVEPEELAVLVVAVMVELLVT